MGFGDSGVGGLLEGFRMANSDIANQHAALAQQAIQQAQMQHAQQELDQQKTSEDNLNKYRTAQSYAQMLKSFQDYQGSGGTGARFAGMWTPAAGDDKTMSAFLDSIKNQGQSPEYLAAQKALKDQGDAETLKAKNAQDNATRQMQEKYFEHLTTVLPQLNPNTAWQAAQSNFPLSGSPSATPSQGGQSGQPPSSSVYPDDHSQLVSDAIAKASKGGTAAPAPGTMTMPSGASAPSLSAMWQQMQGQQSSPLQSSQVVPPQQQLPVNGGTAPPASTLPGAGVPQSLVNPTAPITGDQGQMPNPQSAPPQGLPAPAAPSPIQAINPNPYDGISAAFNLKQAAQAQKDEQEELATQIQEETLRQLRERFPGEQAKAKLEAIQKTQAIKIAAQQADQANKLFPLKLSQAQATLNATNQDSWATVTNAKTNAARLAFNEIQDAADRADKISGGKMTPSQIIAASTNATHLIRLKKDLQSQLTANQAAEATARWYNDPKNVAIPDTNDPNYAKIMKNKSESNSSITGIYDPETQKPGPSPLEAQRIILKDSIDQTDALIKKAQEIINQKGDKKPTDDGGKPTTGMGQNYSRQNASGWTPPPGTIGNGKSHLLLPPKPGAKGLAKVSPPAGVNKKGSFDPKTGKVTYY